MRALSLAAAIAAVAVLAGSAGATGGISQTPITTVATNGFVTSSVTTGGKTYIGGTFTAVGPASGAIAEIDGSSGAATAGLPKVYGGGAMVSAVAPDGSGGFYIGGDFTNVGGTTRTDLAHILANGTVDPNFDPEPDGPVDALAVGSDLVYVGGSFGNIGGAARCNIAAVNADTGVPTNFNPCANAEVRALALSGTTLYLGGDFSNVSGHTRHFAAAVNTTDFGSDTSWDPEPNGSVYSLAVSGSTVYMGGDFGGHLTGVDSGSGATTFTPSAAPDNRVYAIAVAGGHVYAGGLFLHVGAQIQNGLARFDTSGVFDTSWNESTFAAATAALAVSPDGDTVYAGGAFQTMNGLPRNFLASFDASTGNLSNWTPSPDNEVLALATSGSGSGTVFAGGIFGMVGATRNHLAAIDDSTGLLTSWNPNANDEVDSLATDGIDIYAGGQFTQVGGASHHDLVEIGTNGTVSSTNLDANAEVAALAIIDSTLYAGGSFTIIGANAFARTNLAALSTSNGDALPWNPNPDGFVDALVTSGSTVYAGGNFANIGGAPHAGVAALDGSTGNATGFAADVTNGGGDYNVLALSLFNTTLYIGGAFTTVGGQSRDELAAVDATTGAVSSWDPEPNDEVTALTATSSSVFVGGLFSSIGGMGRNFLAELDPSTGNATGWDPEPNSAVDTLTANGAQLAVGGVFQTLGGTPQKGFGIFDLTPPPSISSFSPTSGGAGTHVTITGSNFTGATVVSFHAHQASFSVTDDSHIDAIVPVGATSGTLSVTTPAGSDTSTGSFTVLPAPTISGFSPNHGPWGTSVVVTGTNFTGVTSVKLNGTSASFTPGTTGSLTFTVPTGATSGTISVTNTNGIGTSATAFNVTVPSPTVSSFTPASGHVGDVVKVNGLHFTGATAITFNGTPATTFSVTNDMQISATVPVGATSGHIAVTTPGGTISSVAIYTVLPAIPPVPAITSFTPAAGKHGITSVLIKGSGFTGATSVTFNGSSAAFIVLNDGVIKAVVPLGATTGTISVTTPGGGATSVASFTVT